MATKKTIEKKPTRELRSHELPGWITEKMGDSSVQGFAEKIGITRQALCGVMSGRREPGKNMLGKMKKLGMVEAQRVYIVKK